MADKNFKVKSGLNIPITSAAILTTDSSGNVSSTATLPISAGGTGQTSATNAINALLPVQNGSTINYAIQSDGTNINWGKLYNQTIKNNGTTVTPRGNINVIGATFADDSGTDTTTLTLNPAIKTINEKTGDYILQSSDNNKIIEVNSSSNINITVPTNTVDPVQIGTSISIVNKGSGTVTFLEQTSALPVSSYSAPGNFNSIAYGNSIWISHISSTPYTSADGINWTARTPVTYTTRGVDFVNGNFYLYGVRIYRSTNNGVSWTDLIGSSFSNLINKIKYANGVYIALADNGNLGLSSDGVSWTFSTPIGTTTSDFEDAVYVGNNTWYACLGGSPYIAKSIDNGSTWSSLSTNLTTTKIPRQIFWKNSNLIIPTSNGDVHTSTDGITWTERLTTSNTVGEIVEYNSTFYIFIGKNTSPFTIYFYSSEDGITWSLNDSETLASSFGSTPIGSAVSDSGKIIWSTTTGNLLWTTGTELCVIDSLDSSKKISKRYGKADLYKYASNNWVLSGDLDSKTVDVELNNDSYYNLMGVI